MLRDEEVGVGDGGEGHEEDPVLEVLQQIGGDLQGEPGLARSTRPVSVSKRTSSCRSRSQTSPPPAPVR